MIRRVVSPRFLAALGLGLVVCDLGCDSGSFSKPEVVIDTTTEPKKPAPTASTKVKPTAPTR